MNVIILTKSMDLVRNQRKGIDMGKKHLIRMFDDRRKAKTHCGLDLERDTTFEINKTNCQSCLSTVFNLERNKSGMKGD